MVSTDPQMKKPKWQIIMRVVISALCVIALILAIIAHKMGALMNFVTIGLMAGCVAVILARIPYVINKEIHWGFWAAPIATDNRRYWRPIILRVVFWLLCGLLVTKTVVYAQFDPGTLASIKASTWGMALFLSLISLFPKRIGGKPMSIFSAIGSILLSAVMIDSFYPQLSAKNAVTVYSPFKEASYVFHGGHNTLVNYHVAHQSQQHAMDVVMTDVTGQSRNGASDDLSSYACFGAPLIAPVEGKVVTVVSDLPDQAIGTTNSAEPAGNHVVIKMDDTHYALLAHMQMGSALVEEGDQVEIGDAIGACGNSGNTSEPHLHFQVQRYPDLFAEGGFTYPIKFNGTTRLRSNKKITKEGLFYRRNDRMIPDAP